MDSQEAKRLHLKYQTPDHIIEHCKKVAAVAQQIAKAYMKKGIDIDIESIRDACLLHDLLRIVDIEDKNYEKLCTEASEEDIAIWNEIKAKYKGMDHPQAGYKFLMGLGEEKIALMVIKHRFEAIIDPNLQPFNIEEKIVTYADKRIMHSTLVSLQKRFEDGARRYYAANLHLIPDEEKEAEIYQAYFDLEKELFSKIELKPEDIHL
jgi:5'-deoxynucleotidase YfbR-like HD superfamily hydrolase